MRIVTIFMLLFSCLLYAQETVDVIYLKNGNVLKGISTEKNDRVYVVIDSTTTITLKKSDVASIEKDAAIVEPKPIIPVNTTRKNRNTFKSRYDQSPKATLLWLLFIGFFYGIALFLTARILNIERTFSLAFVVALLNFVLCTIILLSGDHYLAPFYFSGPIHFGIIIGSITLLSSTLTKVMYDISFLRAVSLYLISVLLVFVLACITGLLIQVFFPN